MTAKTRTSPLATKEEVVSEGINSVHIVGSLTAAVVRQTADGNDSITFRVNVFDATGRRDSIDCECDRRGIVARVRRMPVDTRIEVLGALRRSYWRTNAGLASRTFVEVVSVRRT